MAKKSKEREEDELISSLVSNKRRKAKRDTTNSDVCFIGNPLSAAEARRRWPHSYQSKVAPPPLPLFTTSLLSKSPANIDDVIAEKLDVKKISSTSESTFRLADLGCSVGPNTFITMQNIIDVVQQKYQSQGLASHMPEFQVFFNDHASNDFNTLFASLPPRRSYFATGVPGSFHGRLFPESSLHFVHSSYALQWLSKLPEELLKKNSAAWNKGRVHYASAPDEVAQAYTDQFAKDITTFLDCRAKELVVGGLMVLIMPGIPNGIHRSSAPTGMIFGFLGHCLMDMAKEEMTQLVETNGCFDIERMEITQPGARVDGLSGQALTKHLRAGMEGIISKHFGTKIIDELFDRFSKKQQESFNLLESKYNVGTQLFMFFKFIMGTRT
ncbi:putative s-adenosylmethionine-dependent methyltransferase [Quercus suber]|uniref:S-adenosylmethionine-dependent methyltransferase n=1 Tax=Quercus suber TaxID=58331 RepID=A0AAW0LJR9_QUESU